MFSIFKPDLKKRLAKQYQNKVQAAFQAQRNGDIEGYSNLTYEADQLMKKITEINNKSQ
jgi:hypothetical protein